MKTNYITVLIAAAMSLGMLANCSKDFLNRPPQSAVVDVNFYKTDDQLLAGSAPLYSMVWKDFCDQANWHIGDARAGVLMYPWGGAATQFSNFTVSGLTGTNVSAYQAFYEVINQANTIMYNVNKYGSSDLTVATKNHVLGECRFMRATALAYLVMNYGPIAIVDENYTAAVIETGAKNLPQLTPNTVPSIWRFIVKDYRFAAENLATQAPQTGRLTKWSAEGMLARTYLNMAGVNMSKPNGENGTLNNDYLDSAKYYSDRVIRLSGKALLPNYSSLFLYPYDNNNESLFELEWVHTTNDNIRYQYANSMVAQITPSPSISGGGTDGWGGNYTATKWMLSLYDGLYKSDGTAGFTSDQRQKPTFMLPGATYPELIQIKTTTQYSAPVVAAGSASFATIKKYVIGNHPGETDGFNQDDPNDTYMLRLAEMYLIYAEAAVLENNVDATAVTYFNNVHSRAGLDVTHTGDSLKRSDRDLAWEYVFHERVKEFAMEGLAWYDLVRRWYYNDQHVYSIIGKQDRGLWNFQPMPSPYVPANNQDPQGWVFSKISWFTNAGGNFDFITVNKDNFFLPIPQVEKAQAPSLNEAPVDYDFRNYK